MIEQSCHGFNTPFFILTDALNVTWGTNPPRIKKRTNIWSVILHIFFLLAIRIIFYRFYNLQLLH